MKHFQEASLRGRQQMGLYLASNLGGTAIDLLACVLLGVQRVLPRLFCQRAGRLFAGGGTGPRRGPAGRGLNIFFSLPVERGGCPCWHNAQRQPPLFSRFGYSIPQARFFFRQRCQPV